MFCVLARCACVRACLCVRVCAYALYVFVYACQFRLSFFICDKRVRACVLAVPTTHQRVRVCLSISIGRSSRRRAAADHAERVIACMHVRVGSAVICFCFCVLRAVLDHQFAIVLRIACMRACKVRAPAHVRLLCVSCACVCMVCFSSSLRAHERACTCLCFDVHCILSTVLECCCLACACKRVRSGSRASSVCSGARASSVRGQWTWSSS